jgi:glycosyltransferase involved in cell wall biosynthesis
MHKPRPVRRIVTPRNGTADARIVDSDGNSLDRLPRILVATPYYDHVHDIFAQTEESLFFGQGEYFSATKLREATSAVDRARDRAVEIALEQEFDYVMYADADMAFPPGTLLKLLAAMETDADERVYITSGVYNLRRSPFAVAAYFVGDNELISVSDVPDCGFAINNGVFKADAVGTGCMMIDVELFRKYEKRLIYPWFRYWYRPKGKDPKIHRWSEDLVFGTKTARLGVHVFVNTSLVCKHEIRNCAVYQGDNGPEIEVNNERWTFNDSRNIESNAVAANG